MHQKRGCNTTNLTSSMAKWHVAVFLLASTASCFSQSQSTSASGWKAIVQNRLTQYGHRNWIIVADSAFPLYTDPGIETIVVKEDLPSVLKYVAHSISSSRHVRATVFLDKELQFIDEHDYPGVSDLRKQITAPFLKDQVSSIPHSEVLTKLDEAGKTFRILLIKTTVTIPYTSVFMRLDCGYMSDEVGEKIRKAMAGAAPLR
jgi:D-ribose pyranose/furanose isomerase RbsD